MSELARCLAIVWLVGISCAGVGETAAAQTESVPAAINFVVKRNGSTIGTHRLSFHAEPRPDGERLIVDIEIDIAVKAAFVTVYRYTYKGRETWKGGKLLALDSETNDNGTKTTLQVRATEAGLKVDAPDAHYVAPPDTLPDSYWQPDTVKHQRFIDNENGKLVDLISIPAGDRTITVDGKSVEMAVYRLSGENTGEIGYGPDGQWLMLRLLSHGSDIVYSREAR